MNLLEELVDYDRQTNMDVDLGNVIQNNYHTVIGCGGIGYWVATMLGMAGAPALVLVDGDRVEATNMPRIPAPARSIGDFKVKTLKAQLRLLRPGLRITCIPAHINEDTLSMLQDIQLTQSSVVWDCTDDARIQKKISAFCITNRKRYVKLGYDGFKVGMYRKMEEMWLPDDYQPGYTSSNANVMSSVIAAALGIMYLGRDVKRATISNDLEIDLKALVEGRYVMGS